MLHFSRKIKTNISLWVFTLFFVNIILIFLLQALLEIVSIHSLFHLLSELLLLFKLQRRKNARTLNLINFGWIFLRIFFSYKLINLVLLLLVLSSGLVKFLLILCLLLEFFLEKFTKRLRFWLTLLAWFSWFQDEFF